MLRFINPKCADGSTPLHLAAARANVDAVQVLVSNGGSVEGTDHADATALVRALFCGSEPAAK